MTIYDNLESALERLRQANAKTLEVLRAFERRWDAVADAVEATRAKED